MLVRTFLEEHEDGVKFYQIQSDTEGKAVLQVETGDIYGSVVVTDTDPYTYEEVDDPNPPEESENEGEIENGN